MCELIFLIMYIFSANQLLFVNPLMNTRTMKTTGKFSGGFLFQQGFPGISAIRKYVRSGAVRAP